MQTLQIKHLSPNAKLPTRTHTTDSGLDIYARINHIIMTSNPAQCKPGYVDGLYNAIDIISSELESGGSDD